MIYIIGDSHVSSFVSNYIIDLYTPVIKERFCAIRFNPFTAYNVYDKIEFINEKIKNIQIGDNLVVFAFGEVDIRCHLGFKEQINSSIEQCVDRYGKFLLHYKQIFINVGVWAPIASGINNGLQGNKGKQSYKTCIERNKITKYFNQKLLEFCKQNKIKYFSIFDDLQDNFNTKSMYYMNDNIHIGENAHLLIVKAFNDYK